MPGPRLDQDNLPACGAGPVLAAGASGEPDLAATVTGLAERGHARGAAVLAGDFGRAYPPRGRLMQLASYDVPGQRMLDGSDIKHTTIRALPGRPAAPARAKPEDPEQPPQSRSNPR